MVRLTPPDFILTNQNKLIKYSKFGAIETHMYIYMRRSLHLKIQYKILINVFFQYSSLCMDSITVGFELGSNELVVNN